MKRFLILCVACGLQALLLTFGSNAQGKAPTDPESLAKGRKLFRANCAVCHGIDGRVDEDAKKTLDPTPRNYPEAGTGKYAPFKFGTSDQEIFNTITKGSPGTAMASWKKLSEEKRWCLVAWVQHLRLGGAP